MDNLIEEYREAVAKYIKLSHQDTKVRIELQKSRSNLNRIRNEIRATEMELLEIQPN